MSRGKLSTRYECKSCAADKQKKRYAKKKPWYNAYGSEWQKKNKNKTLEYKRKHRIVLKEYVMTYLKSHACVDCSEADVRVLEFDHVRGEKRDNISHMICANFSLASLRAEIDKCEVRCANCHRKKTVERGNQYRSIAKKEKNNEVSQAGIFQSS